MKYYESEINKMDKFLSTDTVSKLNDFEISVGKNTIQVGFAYHKKYFTFFFTQPKFEEKVIMFQIVSARLLSLLTSALIKPQK